MRPPTVFAGASAAECEQLRHLLRGRRRQVHAFFRTRSPGQLLATAAPWTSPWFPASYRQSFWKAA
jgi:hypothetical protein